MTEQAQAGGGILAIWNDCAQGREATFEAWFQGEHLAERLAITGFRLGRRYEAVRAAPVYFNFYVTDSAAILASPQYLERVNNPTLLTTDVMTGVFRNMIRTVFDRTARRGTLRGAFAVTARFPSMPDRSALVRVLDDVTNDHAVACAEIWTAADAGLPPSSEELMRGGDRRIAACLLIETLRQSAAEYVAARLSEWLGGGPEIGIYRLLCSLDPRG